MKLILCKEYRFPPVTLSGHANGVGARDTITSHTQAITQLSCTCLLLSQYQDPSQQEDQEWDTTFYHPLTKLQPRTQYGLSTRLTKLLAPVPRPSLVWRSLTPPSKRLLLYNQFFAEQKNFFIGLWKNILG